MSPKRFMIWFVKSCVVVAVRQPMTKGHGPVGNSICPSANSSVVQLMSKLDGLIFVKNIKIDSEGFKNEEGRDVRVSSIEILLAKKT